MARLPLVISTLLVAVVAADAAAARLPPRDDARKDPSFFAFRRRLQEAVRRRDRSFLLRVLDPKITVNFGGSAGTAEFVRQWKLNEKGSPVWQTLEEVLSHGGTFYKDDGDRGFAAPYTFSTFPDSLDAFEHYCVLAPNVPLRAKPNEHGRLVARLTYDIVRQAAPPREVKELTSSWVEVVTAAGKRGFVARRYVRSPIDYRALFEKRRGKWVMIALISGD